MILAKIALRNLLEHRGRTLIIGGLIALGIALMVIGNSLAETITDGMRASYVENFTGDLIVRTESPDAVAFLPGPGGGSAPLRLEDFETLAATVDADPAVAASAPLLSGVASVGREDDTLGFAVLWATEPDRYRNVFPENFVIEEGRALEEGERGLVLSREVVDGIEDDEGVRLEVGDRLLLSARNDVTGFKIQEVTVVGIGGFATSAGVVDFVSLTDVVTLRTLLGLTDLSAAPAGGAEAAPVPREAVSEDALFGSSLVRDAPDEQGESGGPVDAIDTIDYETILGDTSLRERLLALDSRGWHYLLLRLEPGADAAETEARLEDAADGVVVEDWRWGAGVVADLAFGLRIVLNAAIAVVAVVAVIVITNTLVISVTERTAEIGTIRALGGQRGFVRALITVEVLTIVGVFGLVGMILGSAVVGLLNLIGIPAANLFLQVLFGGPVLEPTLSIGALVGSVAVVAAIGVIASLYPASVALGVPPVQAMQKR